MQKHLPLLQAGYALQITEVLQYMGLDTQVKAAEFQHRAQTTDTCEGLRA